VAVEVPAVGELFLLSVHLVILFAVESHLQSQRAAVKMLHERILVLVQYMTNVIAGTLYAPT
jgi:hypothetical protein